jgi:hypothetical protein
MKYAIILETGSVADTIRPITRLFESGQESEKEHYITAMTAFGNKCHVFEYKETKQLQKSVVSYTAEDAQL